MRNISRLTSILAIAWTAAALLVNTAAAATAPATDQARIVELQQQVDALNQELTRLKGAGDPAAQQQVMQRHWSMMQGYLRSLRGMPGMGAHGCTDWMMMDPGMMGGEMCDGEMWGHGMQSGGMWGMPSRMNPGTYQSQMQGHMQHMRSQMAAIAAQKDPARRQALMREHYQSMYRDMQTMRGMGWMWTPNAAAALPDRDSQGARLVANICSQCHSPPAPSLHTATEWSAVTARMRQHMQDQNNASGSGVRIPSSSELDEITRYLEGHATAR